MLRPSLVHSVPRALLLFSCVCATQLTAIALDATDYERALQAERQLILQIHLEMETDDIRGNGVQVIRSKREVWQDDKNRRCDEIREYLDGKGVTEVPPHRFVTIETPDYFFNWNSRPPKGGGRLCAYFGLKSDVNYRVHRGMLPFDARQLGLVVCDTFSLYGKDRPWELVIGSPNRTATAEIKKEADAVKMVFTRENGMLIEQVYALRGDKQLLRGVTLSQEQYRQTLKCDYPNDQMVAISFPNKLEIKYVNGDYVTYHEISKIRVKSINEAIPKLKFSIASADMPPGTPVIGNAVPPELLRGFPYHHIEWNGEALVPAENRAVIPQNDLIKPEPK